MHASNSKWSPTYTLISQTDQLASLRLCLREPVPGSPSGEPHLAHSNSRERAAFLVTLKEPRKGQPFLSLRRRASLPYPKIMRRSFPIQTPANDPRCIFQPTRERKMPCPHILHWMNNATRISTRGRKRKWGKSKIFNLEVMTWWASTSDPKTQDGSLAANGVLQNRIASIEDSNGLQVKP